MKETKVYVDELPESCFECPIMVDGSEGCDFCVCAILEEKATTKNRLKDCPLHSLKDHDQELVKEVCDEIKNKLGSIEDILINLGNGKEDALSYFMYILNKIQKEFEK